MKQHLCISKSNRCHDKKHKKHKKHTKHKKHKKQNTIAYAYIYNLANPAVVPQVLASCDALGAVGVNFSNFGPLKGIQFDGTSSLTLTQNGVYDANFNVSAIPAIGNELSFKLTTTSMSGTVSTIPGSINTVSIDDSGYGVVNGNVKFIGRVGDKIRIANNLLAEATLNIAS